VKDFTKGEFENLIEDPAPPKKVNEILFCSGKIFYELKDQHLENKTIVRLEQLYPIDLKHLKSVIKKYPDLKQLTWVQEEPSNMGAWDFIRPHLRQLLPPKVTLRYVGRDRSAAPAAGSLALHNAQHQKILKSL